MSFTRSSNQAKVKQPQGNKCSKSDESVKSVKSVKAVRLCDRTQLRVCQPICTSQVSTAGSLPCSTWVCIVPCILDSTIRYFRLCIDHLRFAVPLNVPLSASASRTMLGGQRKVGAFLARSQPRPRTRLSCTGQLVKLDRICFTPAVPVFFSVSFVSFTEDQRGLAHQESGQDSRNNE